MGNIWEKAKINISSMVTPQIYKAWIEPIKFCSMSDNCIKLYVTDSFSREFIRDKYSKIIIDEISSLTDSLHTLDLIIRKNIDNNTSTQTTETVDISPTDVKEISKANSISHVLNKKYTFDRFVCGSGNQFAHAASQAVANNPAQSYNPLFIYGGVGLGKTHLLIAIGNHIHQINNILNICYYTSERFTNEMINCIRYGKMDQFRNKFRQVDVLLIDDIQFIAGKERTMEEFFHTFNSLHEAHKQIVLTSDKFPKDIPGLEARLRSRFEMGLIADIQPPDVETKIAIIRKKAEFDGIFIPDDVAFFLASSKADNIRELEGMIVRLGAFSSLTNCKISLSLAKDILKDIIIEKDSQISIEIIQKVVSEYFQLKISDLKSEKRIKTIVLPRQIAIYLCRELTKSSFPEIGDKFGGKDHTTVMHSCNKIINLLATDSKTQTTISELKRSLLMH